MVHSIKQVLFSLLLALTALLLSSCKLGPNFKPPSTPNTHRYTYSYLKNTNSTTLAHGGKKQYFVRNQPIPTAWWQLFRSKKLNRLIMASIAHNPTLTEAKQNLKAAEQLLKVQQGNLLLPAVNAQLGVARQKTAGLQFGAVQSPSNIFSTYNTGASASYMLDLFGANQRTVEYYQSQVDFAYYQVLATYLTLTTNTVTTAITIASLEDQIKATHELIKVEKNILSILKKQYQFGGTAKENVLLQETTLAQTESTLPPLNKSVEQEQHALAVLTGQLTSKAKPLKLKLINLHLPQKLPVSLPSKLVQQRPDIQEAIATLHGASAKIGVATANLFPQISLSASYGWIAAHPSNLFKAQNAIWDLGANLLQPILHGGALIAARREAYANFRQYYAAYRDAILKAFKDVADALRAIEIDATALRITAHAEHSAQRTFFIAQKRFQVGGQNYLTVLNAQEKLLDNTLNRIKAESARFTDTANLFEALGGNFRTASASARQFQRKHK